MEQTAAQTDKSIPSWCASLFPGHCLPGPRSSGATPPLDRSPRLVLVRKDSTPRICGPVLAQLPSEFDDPFAENLLSLAVSVEEQKARRVQGRERHSESPKKHSAFLPRFGNNSKQQVTGPVDMIEQSRRPSRSCMLRAFSHGWGSRTARRLSRMRGDSVYRRHSRNGRVDMRGKNGAVFSCFH